MQVDRNDPNSVLWLQQALARVIYWRVSLDPTGEFDSATRKAIGLFQLQNNLSQTLEPDTETIARIEQELAVLDTQPYKKKRQPIRPLPAPGTRLGDPIP
jgi:peptidoglycan hydrolase-like protein with peptidoglycan-binding domain